MATRERIEVNFFKPSTPNMQAETRIAKIILLFWLALSYGLPLLIWVAGVMNNSPLGESWFTAKRFLGFPLHYWLIAQGCTIGYVLLCKLYCVLWDQKVKKR